MSRDVEHVLEESYTVRQLIEELQLCGDQDANVLFVCDYGDYHHTQQALPVSEIVEVETDDLAESAYSHSHVAFVGDESEPDEPRPENDDSLPVVILRRG